MKSNLETNTLPKNEIPATLGSRMECFVCFMRVQRILFHQIHPMKIRLLIVGFYASHLKI